MPSPTVRFANRSSLGFYRPDLSLEQIVIFEYFVDIARFSRNGVFKVKLQTLHRELRLNRRKAESLLKWLIDIGLLNEKPREKNSPKCFYFNFHRLIKEPGIIFAMGIPHSPEYNWLTSKDVFNRRLELFKRIRL